MAPLSPELSTYLRRGALLTRTNLNVMCGIGLFIFGWLLLGVFEMLRKTWIGLAYLVPVIVLLITTKTGAVPEAFGLLGLLLYVAGWVHANLILSRYQAQARLRLAVLRQLPADDAASVLEQGLLRYKVLGDKENGLAQLLWAVPLTTDSGWLYAAGTVLLLAKRYAEAHDCFTRALAANQDPSLTRSIRRNLKLAERYLRRQKPSGG